MRLRDRDTVLTREGLIFRVYGYFHPPRAYICDVEYASSKIYRTEDPRAIRKGRSLLYYKFYADEGLRFVKEKYPQYTIFYEPLQRSLVGIRESQIWKTLKPEERLNHLIQQEAEDPLIAALQSLYRLVTSNAGIPGSSLGVFGSILHGFHHPAFSDLDLIVYGKERLDKLLEALRDFYAESTPLRNEFEEERVMEGKHWRFKNLTVKEYIWHQRRKLIYGLYRDKATGRTVKTEFEPVKEWGEIRNEYSSDMRIREVGWIKGRARIIDDEEAPFIPSIYKIEPLDFPGFRGELRRIISYVEEFRMQARRDETVYVEGHLEKVEAPKENYYQVTLSYGPRYYEQTLKVVKS